MYAPADSWNRPAGAAERPSGPQEAPPMFHPDETQALAFIRSDEAARTARRQARVRRARLEPGPEPVAPLEGAPLWLAGLPRAAGERGHAVEQPATAALAGR